MLLGVLAVPAAAFTEFVGAAKLLLHPGVAVNVSPAAIGLGNGATRVIVPTEYCFTVRTLFAFAPLVNLITPELK